MSALAVGEGTSAVDAPNDNLAILTEPLPGDTSGSIALGQSLGSSVSAIRANKMRAFLTMLGIIIGVAAVIVTIALGQGASQSVQARLAGLGTNILSIGGLVAVPGGSRQSLTEADARAIEKQVDGVAAVSPEVWVGNTQVQAGNRNWSTLVRAVYPSYFAMSSWLGIRMAIGAKPGNVLLQFLIEAVLLSLVGGVIGILLGVGGSFALAKLAGWSMAVTWPAIALSFGFAAFVGVIFGYYPARSAARLDPIEALRYD